MTPVPKVSVGLPVYNGQNYLAESLEAILAQRFTDFELIISDNASTDRTEAICREYAARDSRIRYIRQPRNIGAAPNHDFVMRQARGELFKWAAHDDLYGKDLLASCVGVLDTNPEVVLCHAATAIIDEAGTIVRKYDYTMATDSPRASERFWNLLVTDGGDDEYGVIRTRVLRQVRPSASYHNPGRTLVAELALHGRFRQVPEVLYFRRDHPLRGDRHPTIRALCANLEPRRADHATIRLLMEYVWGYVAAIRNAPLSATDRLRCFTYLVWWLVRSSSRRFVWISRSGRRLPSIRVSDAPRVDAAREL